MLIAVQAARFSRYDENSVLSGEMRIDLVSGPLVLATRPHERLHMCKGGEGEVRYLLGFPEQRDTSFNGHLHLYSAFASVRH